MLVPLSVLGGIGNGFAATCCSTLLVTRTPDAERGRVSAAANAALGGAQGLSLLAGGAVAAVLRPRAVYALAGMLGVAGAIATGVYHAAQAGRTRRRPVLPGHGRTGQQLSPAGPTADPRPPATLGQ